MKAWALGIGILMAAVVFPPGACASIIFDSGTTAVTSGDPTQTGRLSRDGIVSDWSSMKAFPGLVNAGTTYRYTTYDVPISIYPFVQITVDDISGNASTFVSAYLNAYSPANKAAGYLGDEGSSGNYFGDIPTAFQVVVNPGNDLIVVVNTTGATGGGVGDPFHLIVEGFTDTNFDDTPPASTPEPATVLLSGAGLCSVALFTYLRRDRSKHANV